MVLTPISGQYWVLRETVKQATQGGLGSEDVVVVDRPDDLRADGMDSVHPAGETPEDCVLTSWSVDAESDRLKAR
jgi:hypothetical protein